MKTVCVAAALVLITHAAAAQIVTQDDPVFGPGSVTGDAAQGLQFLNWGVTAGAGFVPASELSPTGSYEGWRYATVEEIRLLLDHITGQAIPPGSLDCGGGWNYIGSAPGDAVLLQLGTTGDPTFSNAFVPSVGGQTLNLVSVQSDGSTISFGDFVCEADPGVYQNIAGTALVRDIVTSPTYQGRLTDAGAPVNGAADIRMSLIDSFGLEVAPAQDLLGVEVTDGLFSVALPFDDALVSKQDAKIVISARFPAGSGGYTQLDPPQTVAPAPRALAADSADNALLADSALVAGALSNATTQAITLNAPFSAYGAGYEPPSMTRQGNTVVLSGLLRDDAGGGISGAQIATLPVGFRPANRHIFMLMCSTGPARVDVLPTGQITFTASPNAAIAFGWLSLSGISFPVN